MQNSDPILKRIARLAAKEYRSVANQLIAMTELYERTYGVTGKIMRKRRKEKEQPAIQPEKSTRKKHPLEGRQLSQETKDKMRESAIRRWAKKRKPHGNTGRVLSDETKEKLRIAAVRRWARIKAKQKHEG